MLSAYQQIGNHLTLHCRIHSPEGGINMEGPQLNQILSEGYLDWRCWQPYQGGTGFLTWIWPQMLHSGSISGNIETGGVLDTNKLVAKSPYLTNKLQVYHDHRAQDKAMLEEMFHLIVNTVCLVTCTL